MKKYVIRRLILVIPTVFLAGTLVFFMLRVLPGDIVTMLTSEGGATEATKEKLREELGLNDPMIVQYARWLGDMATGNLGYYHNQDRYVTQIVVDKLEATLTLAIFALTFSLSLGFTLGVISAINRGNWLDQGIRIFTGLSLAIPPCWMGIMLIIIMSTTFNWARPIIYTSFISDPW